MDPQAPNPSSSNPQPPHSQPMRAQVVPETQAAPLRVLIEEPPRRFGRLGRRLLWTALVISILFNLSLFGSFQEYGGHDSDVHEKFVSHSRFGSDKVAIISVEGTIMSGEGFIKRQIDAVRHDPHVKVVVLRVDSPGGTVTGSDFIYHHLKEMIAERKIPLVVSMGSMAASGGYYVSMAAGPNGQTIYAEPTCWTGSIGVIIPHYDLAGLLERFDVQDDSVVSHPLKQMGSPTAHFSEAVRKEERAILQQLVDVTFARFKEIVLEARPALKSDEEEQQQVFTGRIFTAGEAKQHHLVDELGFIEDAIERAIVLGGLDPDKVRVVKYQKPVSLVDQLVAGSSTRAPKFDLETLLDLSAPRAYYLCTLLPAAIRQGD